METVLYITVFLGTVLLFWTFNFLIQAGFKELEKFYFLKDKRQFIFDRVPISPLVKITTKRPRTEKRIERANRPPGLTYNNVLVLKELSVWIIITLTIYLFFLNYALSDIILVVGAGLVFALLWPELLLDRLAVKVSYEAKRQLPRVIDLMYVYVVGGYGLEAAVAAVGKHLGGKWGEAFSEASFRLSIGVPFELAFTERALLLDSDFKKFFATLKTARRLGVALSQTLEVQADLLRVRRRQEAESKARRASVLITLPLVLCIFPALLIIYLAPAILNTIHSL